VEVTGASLRNGLLHVELVRQIPEAQKPRRIQIGGAKVVEAAVVGRPDDLTGQAICAFVTVERAYQTDAALKTELMEHVAKEIGKLARPAEIRFTDTLPKTRSGKIMRRLLRDIAAGKETTQDTTTLEDYSILAKLRSDEE
jgi:acetyl-CoA synthetase